MVGRSVLAPGVFKVVDEAKRLLGFTFVQPIVGGSLQRWLLQGKPTTFVVVPWEVDMTLGQWKERVSSPAKSPESWGADGLDGLWSSKCTYIVAKSITYYYGTEGDGVLRDLSSALPQPSFHLGAPQRSPRARAASAPEAFPSRTRGVEASPMGSAQLDVRRAEAAPARMQPGVMGRMRQVDLGDRVLCSKFLTDPWEHPWDNRVGRAFGFECPADPNMFPDWTSSGEYWLMSGSYPTIGVGGSVLAVREGELGTKPLLADFQRKIASEWGPGCSLDVTGCDNYQGDAPPPIAML